MNKNKMICDRYEIINELGRGSTGITYKAIDKKSGDLVALKELLLSQIKDWKTIELFERGTKILKNLSHPNIPQYLNYFQSDKAGDRRFYLVQQLAPGKSLATLIEEGWQPDELTIKYIATQILNILVYLQKQFPPIVHRDIKPQNIIYNLADREVFLVDFGAVQETYYHTITASTIVGTYGYMAPEQFRGKAILSTDLYGLGTTLIFLLTHHSPADLPQCQLKINFRPYTKIEVSKNFYSWLEKLIQPNYKERFFSAQEALNSWRLGSKRKPVVFSFVFLCKNIVFPSAIFSWSLYLCLMIYGSLAASEFLQPFTIFFGVYFISIIRDFVRLNKILTCSFIFVETCITIAILLLFLLILWAEQDMRDPLELYENALLMTSCLIFIDILIFKYPRTLLLKKIQKYFQPI